MAREPEFEALLAAYAVYREYKREEEMCEKSKVKEAEKRTRKMWRRYWGKLESCYEERRGLVKRFESLQALHEAVEWRFRESYWPQMRPPTGR